jgi:hypothetical protein
MRTIARNCCLRVLEQPRTTFFFAFVTCRGSAVKTRVTDVARAACTYTVCQMSRVE